MRKILLFLIFMLMVGSAVAAEPKIGTNWINWNQNVTMGDGYIFNSISAHDAIIYIDDAGLTHVKSETIDKSSALDTYIFQYAADNFHHVIVMDGTYYFNSSLDLSHKQVLFEGINERNVIITKGTGCTGSLIFANLTSPIYDIGPSLKRLELHGEDRTVAGFMAKGVIHTTVMEDVRISNCSIGIYLTDLCIGNDFRDLDLQFNDYGVMIETATSMYVNINRFSGIIQHQQKDGVYILGGVCQAEFNNMIIEYNGQTGEPYCDIHLKPNAVQPRSNIVSHCWIENNKPSIWFENITNNEWAAPRANLIEFNTFTRTGSAGVAAKISGLGNEFRNNFCLPSYNCTIWVQPKAVYTTIKQNQVTYDTLAQFLLDDDGTSTIEDMP